MVLSNEITNERSIVALLRFSSGEGCFSLLLLSSPLQSFAPYPFRVNLDVTGDIVFLDVVVRL